MKGLECKRPDPYKEWTDDKYPLPVPGWKWWPR